jgi:hypothetical protein
LPFLRFARDRRGYETTALMHAFREQGRAQPRILYWFRSPAAVKVGRPPIDEDAIRLIEEHHRGLAFDWSKILDSRVVAEPDRPRVAPERASTPVDRPSRERPVMEANAPGVDVAGPEAESRGERRPRRRARRGDRRPPDAQAASDAETPAARATEAAEVPRAIAAEEAFSVEDLTRLRGRYAALMARIDQEVADPAGAMSLREAAEALNPDTWVTPEDVGAALERYEATYRHLLDRLGPRPRRSKTRMDNE